MDIKLRLKISYFIWTIKAVCKKFLKNKKNDDHLESLLNTLKTFSDNTVMQFGREKPTKVSFKKGSNVKSKNITVNINTEITEWE